MTTERNDWNFETPGKDVPTSFPAGPEKTRVQVDEKGRISRPDWGRLAFDDGRADGVLPTGGGRETPGTSPAAKPAETASTATGKAEKAATAVDAKGKGEEPDADPLAAFDQADIDGMRRQLRAGIRTPEELQAAYGLSASELEAIQGAAKAEKPVAPEGMATVEVKLAKLHEELGEIEELMRTDRRRYNKEFDVRHRELLSEIELAELGTYVGEDVAGTLREQWADEGGVEVRLPIVAGVARTMAESLPDAERAEFASSFDELPAAVRIAAYQQFSVAGGSLSRKVAAIMGGLSGPEKVAAEAWWGKWRGAVERGLVR